MTEVEELITQRVHALWDTVEDEYGPCPSISFKVTGSCAGKANKKEVMFNVKIAEDNLDDFLRATVPHELAHTIVKRKYLHRTQSHGYEWRVACILLGMKYDDIRARHSHTVGRTKIKTEDVQCELCEKVAFVSFVKKHNMQIKRYICRCGGRMK